MSHAVKLDKVLKAYGNFHAVDYISADITNGEFFTLLGPSGCGKTTLLRMIAGFNEIDGGKIYFDDKCVNNIPAHKRNIGMVFQNYAVFPHMSVYENVAYGLKARNVKGNELDKRVLEALDMMKIEQLKDRSPSQLSGGQQQRVALARALVIRPEVLLMDEPLSNLDAKLRLEMRTTIRKIQRSIGITTIYVTHDQEEALAISDHIAVINAGKIEQLGSPDEIYKHPANKFVANFIGTSNFIAGKVKNDQVTILGKLHYPKSLKVTYNGPIVVSARPEHIGLKEVSDDSIACTVSTTTFLGTHYIYEIILPNQEIIKVNNYNTHTGMKYQPGDKVGITLDNDSIMLYDEEGKEALI